MPLLLVAMPLLVRCPRSSSASQATVCQSLTIIQHLLVAGSAQPRDANTNKERRIYKAMASNLIVMASNLLAFQSWAAKARACSPSKVAVQPGTMHSTMKFVTTPSDMMFSFSLPGCPVHRKSGPTQQAADEPAPKVNDF